MMMSGPWIEYSTSQTIITLSEVQRQFKGSQCLFHSLSHRQICREFRVIEGRSLEVQA